MRLSIIIALILTLLSAENREALLIGNSNYKHISNLDDPSYNLNRLKKTLKGLDFKVKIRTNLNSENLESAIDNFATRLSRSNDSIGLLYYTGHGCQVDYQGYLVPTNVDTQQKLKIKYNALNINKMLETLEGAGNRVNMVFLDACRDVPTGTKGGTKGLGQPVKRPKGSLIVYATEAGKVASDNSKFINSLIENISKPNQQIEVLGSTISRDVAKQSQYHQIPEVYVKLLPENFVLKHGGYVPPVEPVVPTPKPHSTKDIVKIGGLMYQNQPFTKEYTWKEAKGYCGGLTLGGYSDWRLPNRSELKRLLTKKSIKSSKGYTQYIRREFVENLSQYSWFWTSTTYEKDSSFAWSVFFNDGDDGWNGKAFQDYALCVR